MNNETRKLILEKAKEQEIQFNEFRSLEQGAKVLINGAYGASGTPASWFYDRDFAECITKQGKHAILYAERCINRYFMKEWIHDTALHKAMGIEVHGEVTGEVSVYIDTDSCYTSYDQVIATTDWCYREGETNWRIKYRKPGDKPNEYKYRYFCGRRSEEYVKRAFGLDNKEKVEEYVLERVKGEVKDFAMLINELKMSKYFKECFDAYAKELSTNNYLNFELETYSDAGIWLSKKKYVQNLRWSDKLAPTDDYPSFSKIKAKGIEMIQPSAPAAARKLIKQLIMWIFQNPKFTINEMRDKVVETKRVFENFPIEDMCWNKRPNGYATYVVKDTDEIKLALKCPATISAMAFYNFLLKKHPKLMTIYPLLRDDNKYKYYYCKPQYGLEMFAFESGLYPKEFAPAIDKDACFEHGVLDPLNRILVSMGFNKLTPQLSTINKLF